MSAPLASPPSTDPTGTPSAGRVHCYVTALDKPALLQSAGPPPVPSPSWLRGYRNQHIREGLIQGPGVAPTWECAQLGATRLVARSQDASTSAVEQRSGRQDLLRPSSKYTSGTLSSSCARYPAQSGALRQYDQQNVKAEDSHTAISVVIASVEDDQRQPRQIDREVDVDADSPAVYSSSAAAVASITSDSVMSSCSGPTAPIDPVTSSSSGSGADTSLSAAIASSVPPAALDATSSDAAKPTQQPVATVTSALRYVDAMFQGVSVRLVAHLGASASIIGKSDYDQPRSSACLLETDSAFIPCLVPAHVGNRRINNFRFYVTIDGWPPPVRLRPRYDARAPQKFSLSRGGKMFPQEKFFFPRREGKCGDDSPAGHQRRQ